MSEGCVIELFKNCPSPLAIPHLLPGALVVLLVDDPTGGGRLHLHLEQEEEGRRRRRRRRRGWPPPPGARTGPARRPGTSAWLECFII